MLKYLPWEAWEEIRSQTGVVSLPAFSRPPAVNHDQLALLWAKPVPDGHGSRPAMTAERCADPGSPAGLRGQCNKMTI